MPFTGLAAGASATMNYTSNGGIICGRHVECRGDSSNVVPESNEGNNTKTAFDDTGPILAPNRLAWTPVHDALGDDAHKSPLDGVLQRGLSCCRSMRA